MVKAVNDAYQSVADYASSSPYPVGLPAVFDKTEALQALKKATEVCNEYADKVYNVSDIINRYNKGEWVLSSGTLTKLDDFIGFVLTPNNSSSEKDKTNDRFKFL